MLLEKPLKRRMKNARKSQSDKYSVPASGSVLSEVMIVGYRPGKSELQAREPFSGPAGELVRLVAESILSRVYYTNLVKDPVSPGSLAEKIHQGNIAGEIAQVAPKVIITFGSEVSSYILDQKCSIKVVHGLLIPTERFGKCFLTLPLYDPGFIIRNGGFDSGIGLEWVDDWQELRQVDGLRDIQTHS